MKNTKIKSFEHACEVLGISTDLPIVDGISEKHRQSTVSFYKLSIIVEATNKLNKNWKADYNNHSQLKYAPWFTQSASGSGFGFSYADCSWAFTFADCGARLCTGTGADAEHIGETFTDLYNDIFIVQE